MIKATVYPTMIKAALLSYLLLLSAFSHAAQEQSLYLDNKTHAIYHPSNTHKAKAAVLMIHGWTGTLDEVGNLYKRLAAELAKIGIASIRVQINGEFNTAGFRLESTFDSRVEDATRGLKFILSKHFEAPIGVVGFSLGGATAIALAGNQHEHIDSIVLWSSTVNPREVEQNLLSKADIETIEQDGEKTIQSYQPFVFTKKHLLGLRGHNHLLKAFEDYTGGLYMIRGSKDSLKQHEPAVMALTNASPAEYTIIKGADHIFQVLDQNSQFDERLLWLTSNWFAQDLLRAGVE